MAAENKESKTHIAPIPVFKDKQLQESRTFFSGNVHAGLLRIRQQCIEKGNGKAFYILVKHHPEAPELIIIDLLCQVSKEKVQLLSVAMALLDVDAEQISSSYPDVSSLSVGWKPVSSEHFAAAQLRSQIIYALKHIKKDFDTLPFAEKLIPNVVKYIKKVVGGQEGLSEDLAGIGIVRSLVPRQELAIPLPQEPEEQRDDEEEYEEESEDEEDEEYGEESENRDAKAEAKSVTSESLLEQHKNMEQDADGLVKIIILFLDMDMTLILSSLDYIVDVVLLFLFPVDAQQKHRLEIRKFEDEEFSNYLHKSIGSSKFVHPSEREFLIEKLMQNVTDFRLLIKEHEVFLSYPEKYQEEVAKTRSYLVNFILPLLKPACEGLGPLLNKLHEKGIKLCMLSRAKDKLLIRDSLFVDKLNVKRKIASSIDTPDCALGMSQNKSDAGYHFAEKYGQVLMQFNPGPRVKELYINALLCDDNEDYVEAFKKLSRIARTQDKRMIQIKGDAILAPPPSEAKTSRPSGQKTIVELINEKIEKMLAPPQILDQAHRSDSSASSAAASVGAGDASGMALLPGTLGALSLFSTPPSSARKNEEQPKATDSKKAIAGDPAKTSAQSPGAKSGRKHKKKNGKPHRQS